MKVFRHRDLSIIDLNNKQRLVISCDSAGGIGDKEYDVVKTTPEIIGYYTTNVALMELISYGAKPISLVNNLSVEMDPAGRGIIRGIEKALEPIKFDSENFITGSTEENIPVTLTGLGITIIGIVDLSTWKEPRSYSGDLLAVVGIPKLGDEVLADEEKTIMNIERTLRLKKLDYINEILPVGSKGIRYELGELAKTNNLNFELKDNIDINIDVTAGPATCVIVSLDNEKLDSLKKDIDIPVNVLGWLK